ncbi:MAG: lipid-A-disaccharide synthase [Bryobacteraceae bacterium]
MSRILISAGEASGDLYASLLAEKLAGHHLFGCTGPRMRAAGVRTVVDSASLAVVGIAEVITHIPRIYGEYRKLLAAARQERPDLAVLTDSPDFHLRVARRLHQWGIPVVYLVAPQVWAWRRGRLRALRRDLRHLLCIFPFEEQFFRYHGVRSTYLGHPLAGLVKPTLSRTDFFRKHGLSANRPLITVMPGSRRNEAGRHLPVLADAVRRIHKETGAAFLLPAAAIAGAGFFRERIGDAPIQVIEGENWDAMAHAGLVLAASGTVTVEAALLGVPMVTFYKVSPATWLVGRPLVHVPHYSMVNLVAGRQVVPELIQHDMTASRIAAEALRLLGDTAALARMRAELADTARKLSPQGDPMEKAAAIIHEILEGKTAHAS